MSDDTRRQIRRILENAAGHGSLVIQTTVHPEITFKAYDEAGNEAGEVEVYLAETNGDWYLAVLLIIAGEPQLIVRDEYVGSSRQEALEAAVLKANDAANEHGYTADV